MLTEEKINANFLKFRNYLEKYDCFSEEMFNEIGEKIKYAPFSREKEYGGAEPGSLIDVTLNKLCKIGAEINTNTLGQNGKEKFLHPMLCVNQRMLMRVLLLCNIGKAEMFVRTEEQWKLNKGINYDFVENKTKMKLGQRSLYLCQKYGIQLEEEEFDAFYSIDKTEEGSEGFNSPLYTIVKAAKAFTLVELRQEYLREVENNKQTKEK